jgi:hypothetical protein
MEKKMKIIGVSVSGLETLLIPFRLIGTIQKCWRHLPGGARVQALLGFREAAYVVVAPSEPDSRRARIQCQPKIIPRNT